MKRESRLLLRSLDSTSHPFARRDEAPLVRDGASAPCYRATPRFASRLPSALRRRCFEPTSATDFSKRAPIQIAGFPSVAACAAPTSLRRRNGPRPASDSAVTDARPPCGNPAPNEPRLTAPAQLRSSRSRASTPRGEQLLGNPKFGLPCSPRRFQPRAIPTRETSDAPCRAPTYVPSSRPTPSSRNQNRFHYRRVNAGSFPGPERLPSTSAREIPSETSEPATDRTVLPPCSGFRRCFAFPTLSRGWARPEP